MPLSPVQTKYVEPTLTARARGDQSTMPMQSSETAMNVILANRDMFFIKRVERANDQS